MKRYVAFLRGINVGGKNSVSMKSLRELFSSSYYDVVTYLNSGNVIFSSDNDDVDYISRDISNKIESVLGMKILVYVISVSDLEELLDNSPSWWGGSSSDIYDNVIFIIRPYTYYDVSLALGSPDSRYEKVFNYKDKVFWSFDLNNYRKSVWWKKSASSSVSGFITIRTANTVRKVLEICKR